MFLGHQKKKKSNVKVKFSDDNPICKREKPTSFCKQQKFFSSRNSASSSLNPFHHTEQKCKNYKNIRVYPWNPKI